MIQNDILSTLLLQRKNYLVDIHKCIGDKNIMKYLVKK